MGGGQKGRTICEAPGPGVVGMPSALTPDPQGHMGNPSGGGGRGSVGASLAPETVVAELQSLSTERPWRIPQEGISLNQGSLEHPDRQWLQLTA